MSVPIDALANEGAIEQALWAWIVSAAEGVTPGNVNPRVLDLNRHRARAAIRAAIAHVIGGEL